MNLALLEQDRKLTQSIQQWVMPHPWRVRAALILAHSGDSIVCYLVLGIVAICGASFWRDFALRLLLVMTLNAIPIVVMKYTLRRERPESRYGILYRRSDPHSFPSGHAARTFLIAVMSTLTSSPFPGVILLLWASLVSLARVGLGLHHISDTIAGAILGSVVALASIAFLP